MDKPEKKEFNANENAIQTGLRMAHNEGYDDVMAWHNSVIEKLADEYILECVLYEVRSQNGDKVCSDRKIATAIARHIRKELS